MLSEQWKLVEDAVRLKDDETANEQIKTLAAGLDALAAIVQSHRDDGAISRLRERGTLTD